MKKDIYIRDTKTKKHNQCKMLQTLHKSLQMLPVQRSVKFSTGITLLGRFHNPKISMTMLKNQNKNMEKFVAEEIEKQEKAAKKGPSSSPKDPIIYDNNRTQIFNRQFMENIGQVMAEIPQLRGHGLCITKVHFVNVYVQSSVTSLLSLQANVVPDFSEVRVFWVSSRTEPEEAAQLLEENVSKIRKYMYNALGIGRMPKIAFVLDNNYLHQQKMDELFARLNTNPDYVNSKDDKKILNVWEEASDSLELESSGEGVDRESILSMLNSSIEKSKAAHRFQYSEQDFETVYRETIHQHGLARKVAVKNNIKKFLTERKKLQKHQMNTSSN